MRVTGCIRQLIPGTGAWVVLACMLVGCAGGSGRTAVLAAPFMRVVARPNPRFTLARVDDCFVVPTGASTSWPLAPTGRVHGIRGSWNEPRGAGHSHWGTDVEAVRNRAPVYAMAAGVVFGVTIRHLIEDAGGGMDLWYWHVRPLSVIHDGTDVSRGQLIGHVLTVNYHVNIVESESGCGWVNPMRPGGPLHIGRNTERPSIGVLRAFRGNAAAYQRFSTRRDPATVTDPATPEQLDALHGYVDLRAQVYDWPTVPMVARPQLALEPAAIRAWLAPRHHPHWHLSPIKLIYNGAGYFRPRRLGTTRWHIWAFGTWRNNTGYYETDPDARHDLAANYIWHVGGTNGLNTRRYADRTYQYCVQALTINGVGRTRCTPVRIAN